MADANGMIDVTEVVQRYRLALRHIWNSCIYADPELRDWESVYAFRHLKLPLFNAVVSNALEVEATDKLFGPDFRVAPASEPGLSLQIDRREPDDAKHAGGLYEDREGPFQADQVGLSLVDLFDWMELGYIDLRYYLVLIESFPAQPDKIGHRGLVDVTEARVFHRADGGNA